MVIEYERPNLYPKQEHAIFYPWDSTGQLARYSLIEAATKTGKTVGCIAWLFEKAILGKAGQNRWWVAPIYGQAKIAFERMRRAYPDGTFDANESELTLRLKSVDNVIWFKSGEKPDNLYGEDVYDAVIDEASRLREESWHAIRSTITATRGDLRIIGNIKGRQNWFYSLARKAEAGESGMAYFKILASDAVAAGILASEEIASAKRDLPESVFRELYMAEPSDDGGNPFGLDAIRRCIGPLSGKIPAVWGVDLAKSVDWTAMVALDEDGKVCRFERFQKPWMETLATIRTLTGGAPTLLDSTGVGDPIVEALQREQNGNYEGFKFSSSSKQQIMEGLALAIQQGLITIPDGVLVNELEQFEYQYTRTGVQYAGMEGTHDDCVCALALAVHKRVRAYAGFGILEHYRREAVAVNLGRAAEIKYTTSLAPVDGALRMRMPRGTSSAYGITGRGYSADADGVFVATAEDAAAFKRNGFELVSP